MTKNIPDMDAEELQALMDDHYKPAWAIRKSNGTYEVGSQLPTKDGRIVGNAHIIKIEPAFWNFMVPLHTVLTDAGTTVRYVKEELEERFHPPQWVSDVNDVLARFSPRPLGRLVPHAVAPGDKFS